MIASEPSPSGDPGDTPFDHPSSGKWAKPRWSRLLSLTLGWIGNAWWLLRWLRTPNNVDGPAQMHQQPEDQIAPVIAVSPELLDLGEELFQRLQQAFGSLLIGAVRPSDQDCQHMALRVNEQVPFASPDFFPAS